MVTLAKMMHSSIKKNPLREKIHISRKPAKKFLCFTLRQWSLLFGILLFIFMIVFSICVVLGNLHTRDLIKILRNDIQNEDEKLDFAGGGQIYDIMANEKKLKESLDLIWMYCGILTNLIWLSALNLISNGVMIYGVANMIPNYILQWIFISLLSCVFANAVVTLAYFRVITFFHASQPLLWITYGFAIVYLVMWRTITTYFNKLTETKGKLTFSRSNFCHAHGGYTHTLNSATNTPKKSQSLPISSHQSHHHFTTNIN